MDYEDHRLNKRELSTDNDVFIQFFVTMLKSQSTIKCGGFSMLSKL